MICLCFLPAILQVAIAKSENCRSETAVASSWSYAIESNSKQVVRQLQPFFFSFNLEWVEFQGSLWDSPSHKVRAEVIDWLQAFPDAIYRYPGGTISNTVHWKDLIGDLKQRPARKFVSWLDPFIAEFGIDEYLQFVKEVHGRAWYVANIYGDAKGEGLLKEQAAQAYQLGAYLTKKRQEGMPAIFRWELGNELDRDIYQWLPEKLSTAAITSVKEIQRADKEAKFVILMEEYPALERLGISASQYNRRLSSKLVNQMHEHAFHLYYDGEPQVPHVPHRINSLCEAIGDAGNADSNRPVFWMTEHGRWPPGDIDDSRWKAGWWRTASLEAALSVADMLITVAQIPEVHGTFIHALHGTNGPWPLFHQNGNKVLYPSAVNWALQIMRNSMQENVLATLSKSRNQSNYKGGYDMRSVVMVDTAKKNYSIWMVNRNGNPIQAMLKIPDLKSLKLKAQHVWLSNTDINATNYTDAGQVQPQKAPLMLDFNLSGSTLITLPPFSISTLSFQAN